jgi:hypothetical protein
MGRLEGGPASRLDGDTSAQLPLLPQLAPPREAAAAQIAPLLARLTAVDLDRTTPLEALQILAELKTLR